MVTACMEIEIIQPLEDWVLTVKKLRNDIIGSNNRKESALIHVPKLLEFLQDPSCPVELKIESAIVLGSLAKGTSSQVLRLFENGVVQVLLKCVDNENVKFVERCLSCIKSIVCRVEPSKSLIFSESESVPKLVSLLCRSQSCKECVAVIFYRSCKTSEHQHFLYKNGLVQGIVELLSSPSNRVQIAAMRCLLVIIFQNVEVSNSVVECTSADSSVLELLLRLQQRDKPIEMQLCAAKCLACLLKNDVVKCKKEVMIKKVMATLVFMCQPDKMWVHRCEGAHCLAYFTEDDIDLQYLASISGQIISALSDYFNYDNNNFDSIIADAYNGSTMLSDLEEHNLANELRKSAFNAYASLAANIEDVRKRVLDSSSIKQYLVEGLADPDNSVKVSAMTCLLSLSRSVHQLRTNFDKKIGGFVFDAFMSTNDEELLGVCTAMLSNVLLDFSPLKEFILNEKETVNTEFGSVERHSVVVLKLLKLTRSDNVRIKLNAIWCIMNMTYMWPDEEKEYLLSALRNDDIFHLIRSDNVEVVLKALGTIRNLISTETHSVDYVMNRIGRKVMEVVVLVLEGDFPVEVKEQALCILVNISSGETSKTCIMANMDVLRKITNYLVHDCKRLQLSAIDCIFNLVKHEHEGYLDRQEVFQQLQVQNVLQNLQNAMNSSDLRDRAKQTSEMF